MSTILGYFNWRGVRMQLSNRFSIVWIALVLVFSEIGASAQSVASGTIEGTVVDSTGGVVVGATIEITNPLTGFQQTAVTDAMGAFRFTNIPFNPYHLQATQTGFAPAAQDVNVRTTVPIPVKIMLSVAGLSETVRVEAGAGDIIENVPYAHVDVGVSTLDKLPVLSPAAGLSDAITLASPGVVADSNGFFHPLGDHAQTSFAIDGQPISDQQSKAFSTQIPVNAIQNMEIVTGTPNAEFGDKTSLVINATTRSGLGLTKPRGEVVAQYGSFGTPSVETNVGIGGQKAGWFIAANGLRSGRFLDTPEFNPIHAVGNSSNTFNRFDFVPTEKDVVHVNLMLARNWFQTPNSFDQPDQDQRQKVVTLDFAPGYQHTFNPRTLLTINPFVRQDRVHYYPSPDAANDTPATVSQSRRLTNWGVRGDVSYSVAQHNLKIGGQVVQTHLQEDLALGITDFAFNPVCLNDAGDPQELPTVTNTSQCASSGFVANPGFNTGLLPLDLRRGGSLFQFGADGNVNQYAFYIQDAMTLGHLTFSPGLRVDHYDAFGIIKNTEAQPRLGVSYLIAPTNTVLRAGYARTMETPYNENLLVATSPIASALIEAFSEEGGAPLNPGHRHQFNLGVQQALSRYVQVEADYFWKYTNNAYDFGVLFNTPIAFPITWPKSRLDGFSLRVSSTNIKGLQWYTTMGHNRARFFTEDGGVFRIDHDQNFQQTTNVRYQWKKNGPWGAFTWRYDSGLVAGAVASLEDALALTPAEQAAIGFSCGGQAATPDNGITSCNTNFGTTRLRIPAEGAADDDHNPPRIAARNIFDVGMGTDRLLGRQDGSHVTMRFTISNVTNKIALYNFHSTFSGTHFIAPRTYQGSIGFVF
jgi:Carboxypeptidase regulatory-like domain